MCSRFLCITKGAVVGALLGLSSTLFFWQKNKVGTAVGLSEFSRRHVAPRFFPPPDAATEQVLASFLMTHLVRGWRRRTIPGRQDVVLCRAWHSFRPILVQISPRPRFHPLPGFTLSQILPRSRFHTAPDSTPGQVVFPRVPRRPGFHPPRSERPQTRASARSAARPDSPAPQETRAPRIARRPGKSSFLTK